MEGVGLMQSITQGMGPVIRGIAEAVQGASRRADCEGGDHNKDVLSCANYDNRFAHDLPLLFHLANMMLRHAVNKSVGARVKSSSSAFADFVKTINDENFTAMVEEAKGDPNGAAARLVRKLPRPMPTPVHTHVHYTSTGLMRMHTLQVTKTVLRFINLSGRNVPWGNRERAGEMTLQMALHRYAGPATVFHTCAPDDVHNPDIIRWAHAFTGYGEFPANSTAEFEQVR